MKAQSLLLLLEELSLTDAEQLLDYGIRTDQVDMVRRALQSGRIHAIRFHFFKALDRLSINVVKLFLDEFGVSPDAENEAYDSALQFAARNDYVDLMKLLLSYGADINKKSTFNGWTALHQAIIYGSLDTIRFLLDNGANQRVITKNGSTAFDMIADYDDARRDLLREYDPKYYD